MKMKKQLFQFGFISALLFGGLLKSAHAQTVIFSEDFEVATTPVGSVGFSTLPAGWLSVNVDQAPTYYTDFTTNAWLRSNSAAGGTASIRSTSWNTNSPISSSDDWVWTPAISLPNTTGLFLEWEAAATDVDYRDGYEVRIMVGTAPNGSAGNIGNMIANSTVLYSIGSENASYTSRSVDISLYANNTVYIGFRNNSYDKNMLEIDNIKVVEKEQFDIAASSLSFGEYSIVPVNQIQPFTISGGVKNVGLNTLTNIAGTINIYNSGGTLVQTLYSTNSISSLTANSTATLQFGTWTPPSNVETYTIKFFGTSSSAVTNPSNDTIIEPLIISNKYFARHQSPKHPVGLSIGVNSGETGYIGQVYNLTTGGKIDSISVTFNEIIAGTSVNLAIFNTTGAGIPTGSPIAYTSAVTASTTGNDVVYKVPMQNGPWTFTPGKYFIGFIETYASDYSLNTYKSKFTNNTVYVQWGSNAWASVETYGADFAKSFAIVPGILPNCTANVVDVQNTVINSVSCLGNDGSITLGLLSNGNYSYTWSNGQTTKDISGLAPGNYIVLVKDLTTLCEQTVTFTVNSASGMTITPTAVDASCNGGQGQLSATVTGGTAPYTYAWSNGSTGSSATAGAGSYTVTVTDANGCVMLSTSVTISEPTAISVNANATDVTCAGCTDGSLSAVASGGAAPYSYMWTPGNYATDVVYNVAAGTYTVVITDDNGCTATETVSVVDNNSSNPTSLENFNNEDMMVYPNPNNGEFVIRFKGAVQGNATIDILDIQGKLVYSFKDKVGNTISGTKVDVKYLSSGTYMVRVSVGGKVYNNRVVIK